MSPIPRLPQIEHLCADVDGKAAGPGKAVGKSYLATRGCWHRVDDGTVLFFPLGVAITDWRKKKNSVASRAKANVAKRGSSGLSDATNQLFGGGRF